MAVGKLSLDGIISKEGVIYDDLIEDAPTPDMQATRKSEAAWKAIMPEANAVGPQLRIVGETAVGAHIEVQSISTEQTIPVHVEHPSAAWREALVTIKTATKCVAVYIWLPPRYTIM